MRLLDPVFQTAMDSGRFTPIVRAAVIDPDDYSILQYLDLVYFKINGIDIDIEFYDDSGSFTDSVSLERGVKIGDTEYTIFSGIYKLTSSYKVQGGKYGLYICSGSLIEPAGVSLAADVTYETIITNVLALGTCTPTFKTPAAAWLDYQFLTDGALFHTSNIYTFFSLLRQKYLVFATENGPDDILFFSVSDVLALASQYTLTLNKIDIWSSLTNYRQFVWKDEAGTIHTDGTAGHPIHNLGYLESTASPPAITNHRMPIGETLLTVIPNLKYQTGDCVSFDPDIPGLLAVKTVLDVTEIFDARTKTVSNPRYKPERPPTWKMELRPLFYFSNTEGGYIATQSQYTMPYVSLATNGFNGFLDTNVNNLQVFADTVDDLAVSNGGVAGTAGRLAQFSAAQAIESANIIGPAANVLTITNSAAATLALAISSGKTLTFTATNSYNLTIPATGTAVLGTGSSSRVSYWSGTNTQTGASTFTYQTGASPNLTVQSAAATHVAFLAQGAASQTADIFDVKSSTGTLLFGVSAGGHVGIGITPLANVGVYSYLAATDLAYIYGGQYYINATITTDKSGNYAGFKNLIDFRGTAKYTNVDNGASLNQLSIYSNNAQLSGVISRAIFTSATAKTTDQYVGFRSLISFYTANDTVTDCYGVYIDAPYKLAAGTITNLYGLYIADQLAGATLNYAIVTNSGNIIFNNGGVAAADFTDKTDNYNAIFVDASNDSIVIMSDAAGKVGFFGAAAIVQPAAYTPSNVTPDRSYDADASTIDELSDVLGTLISDLQSLGLVG
jgi:hypothetical protein